jgi:hypothetical protein
MAGGWVCEHCTTGAEALAIFAGHIDHLALVALDPDTWETDRRALVEILDTLRAVPSAAWDVIDA